ncbi:hypothetical protein [Actinomadura sp. SCN-SB]|uniref:hypothetical protein n=1 Tax=Actinomadura sp. SCN-SB TaxID=3373092 RepID=UPI003751F022
MIRRLPGTGARLAVAAATCGTLLAGCSEDPPPPPIEIGRARPSGQRITYPTVYDPSGHFAFDQWPPACSLLTKAELASVLPQARNITHKQQDGKFRLRFSGRRVTAKGASCTITFGLPGMTGSVTISEDATGRLVDTRQNRLTENPGKVDVGGGCTTDNTIKIECKRGQVAFSLEVHLSYQNNKPSADENRVRYSMGGKVTTFSSNNDIKQRWAFERQHLIVPLGKMAAAKL